LISTEVKNLLMAVAAWSMALTPISAALGEAVTAGSIREGINEPQLHRHPQF
jgi:hypothetical protein